MLRELSLNFENLPTIDSMDAPCSHAGELRKAKFFWYNGCLIGLPCSSEREPETLSNKLKKL
jgi:hypothetical protein